MKKYIPFIAAVLAASPLQGAPVAPGMQQPQEVAAADGAGFLARGLMMEADANYQGTIDQLSRALQLHLSEQQRETALLHLAHATAHISSADAESLYREFLGRYPASAYRQQALLGVADCIYDRGEYGNALLAYSDVTPGALDNPTADLRDYRMAYCLLKLTRYDEAAAIYRRLENSAGFAPQARFYNGYIAYVSGDTKRAEKLFESVQQLTTEPCNRAPYYLAQIYFARRDYTKAISECRRLQSTGSIPAEYAAETQRILGESLYNTGETRQGVDALKTYLTMTDTPLPSALYLLGVEEYRAGNYARAIEYLTPATSEVSALGQSAYLYIGQSYLRQANYDAASMALQNACRMDFDPATREMAYYDYAIAHLKGGRTPFGSSVSLFEEFLRRYPDSSLAPQVQDYVINGYVTDNNYAAALKALDHIKNPTQAQKKARLQVLYLWGTRRLQAGDTDGAITNLREAVSLASLDPRTGAEAQLWLGEALYKKGNYRQADAAFTSYLDSGYATGANKSQAYYDRGYGRFARKQVQGAESDFRQFLNRAPKGVSNTQRADALNRVADCLYYNHNFTEAAATYARALEMEPSAGDYPLYQQAMMKGLSGDNSAKIDLLSSMMKRFPKSTLMPSALLETADAYSALDNSRRALDNYLAVADRYPSTAQGRRGLLLSGLTYLNMGDNAAAKKQYRKVISLYPTSEEARAAADDLKHLSADEGTLADYSQFLASVPDAPKLEAGEAAALLLQSAQKAQDEGRTADALARAAELAETYPDSPEAVQALAIKARAEELSGKAPLALATYRIMAEKASSGADANTARLGIMRLSFTMNEYSAAIEAADALLASSAIGADVKSEATFTKALALQKQGKGAESMQLLQTLTGDPESLWGAKSLYYLAQQQFDARQTDEADRTVNRLIDANPPHDYWLARGFILLSDIRRRQGNSFEADEYLRSLRENYPGDEADIMRMIDQRLNKN